MPLSVLSVPAVAYGEYAVKYSQKKIIDFLNFIQSYFMEEATCQKNVFPVFSERLL